MGDLTLVWFPWGSLTDTPSFMFKLFHCVSPFREYLTHFKSFINFALLNHLKYVFKYSNFLPKSMWMVCLVSYSVFF